MKIEGTRTLLRKVITGGFFCKFYVDQVCVLLIRNSVLYI